MTDLTNASNAPTSSSIADAGQPIWSRGTAAAASAMAALIVVADILFCWHEPGISLALYWLAGLAVAATWLLMALGLRISSLSALIAVALAPFFFWLTGHGAYAPVLALLALLIVIMHHANIRRLLNGTEPRIGSKARTASNSEATGHKKRGG